MTDTRGLHNKFTVTRNDGKDAEGEKHEGCEYFVLDLTHDLAARHVIPPLAAAYDHFGRHALADDLRKLLARFEATYEEATDG